jgi:ATP-binding cassette, subfamily B, bacterial
MILPLFITLILAFLVISYFDKIIVALSQERNISQHKSSALLFDFLSNIKTIITLKAERTTKNVYIDSLNKEIPIANKRALYNETKRFLIDVIVNLSVIVGLVGYIWYQWKYI